MSLGSANCTKVDQGGAEGRALASVCVAAVTLCRQGERRATVQRTCHTGHYRIDNVINVLDMIAIACNKGIAVENIYSNVSQ